ncbi:MAG: hypothetical protein K8R37_02555, partial [Bacteroidales bacterium]|nr:hypothetical protein [Bacteroidales bacterium]
KNLKSSLANEISSLINTNFDKLKRKSDWIHCELLSENSKKIASTVSFEPLKFGMHSLFHGKNNIYLNYYFDDIYFSMKDLESTAEYIFNRKNNGKAEILIIWVEIFEILYKTKELAKILTEKFKESSFKHIVLFSYLDRKDLFFESNRFIKIK